MREPTLRGRRGAAIGALVTVLGLLFLTGCGGRSTGGGPEVELGADDGYHGTVLDQPYAVPDTTLNDTSGASYSIAAGTGLSLVFFGYTNCPDTCQIVMASLASAMNRLQPADRERVTVVLVTTDPARDDEAQLRAYLDRFDPSFVGLTGDLDTIKSLATTQAISVEKGKRLPSGGYEVDHSTPVLGIEAGRTTIVWNAETSPAEFADDVTRLLAQQGSGS